MQIMDVVFQYRDGGESQKAVCTCETSTGVGTELLVALLKIYREHVGQWRVQTMCELPELPEDSPTIVCRMLDVFSGCGSGSSNPLPLCTTIWSEYGIPDADKQIILSVYLEHSLSWRNHFCEDRMLPAA